MDKYRNKAFIICTEFYMLPYQSKLSVTSMSPSCYLLLFKSENNKKGRLTWVSNLPTLLVPEKEKASRLLGMQQGSCSSVNLSQTCYLPTQCTWTNDPIAFNLIFLSSKMEVWTGPKLIGLLWGVWLNVKAVRHAGIGDSVAALLCFSLQSALSEICAFGQVVQLLCASLVSSVK